MAPLDFSVALIGKLGHGKTRVLNTVCGTHFASQGGSKSVTRSAEMGVSKLFGIAIIDTPGLAPTEDVAGHVAAQKLALEMTPLSGVYLVLKCGRDGDMIDDQINDIIDMVGEDSIRIIITHPDVEAKKGAFNANETKRSVSRLAGIEMEFISMVGLETTGQEIEKFIECTLLSEPKQIELKIEEVSRLASRSQQSRRIDKAIRDIYAKIDAAQEYCNGFETVAKSHHQDVMIMDIQQDVTTMVQEEKERVFRDVVTNLSIDTQTICFARAGPSLSIRLKKMIEHTNKLLSWNVCDPSDPRNNYRACNHCGAVFTKVEGCDGATQCGALPKTRDESFWGSISYFFRHEWLLNSGRWILSPRKQNRIRNLSLNANNATETVHQKRPGSIIESGCGQTIEWTSMRPIEPEVVAALGRVESLHAGTFEDFSGQRFQMEVNSRRRLTRRA